MPDRWGSRHPGWAWVLLSVPLMVIWTTLVLGPIFAAQWITTTLDDIGLPGFAFAMALMLAGPVVALWYTRRSVGSVSRARVMREVARQSGLRFAPALSVPFSMTALPSFAGFGVITKGRGWSAQRGAADLVAGHVKHEAIVAFDYWVHGEGPYGRPRWHTLIAVGTDLEAAPLLVEPRSRTESPKAAGVREVRSESIDFERRYRAWTTDPRFASTFLDQRMLAWLLDVEGHWEFQVGGTWVAVSDKLLDPERFPAGMELVRAFRDHIPRVAHDLYRRSDPVWR